MIDEAELARLQSDMATAAAENNWPAHIAAEVELENLFLADASQRLAEARFDIAAGEYQIVRQLNEGLLTTLPESPVGDAEVDDRVARTRSGAAHSALLSGAMAGLANGLYTMLKRNPGVAANYFNGAQQLFNAASKGSKGIVEATLARYADALQLYASGLEACFVLNYGDAEARLQKAKVRMDALVKDLPENPDEEDAAFLAGFVPRLKQDAVGVSLWYLTASFYRLKAQGLYEEALRRGEKLLEVATQGVQQLTADTPDWVRYSTEAMLHWRRADCEVVRAQSLMDRWNWNEAEAAFESARLEYQAAAESILKTEIPEASASQETFLNQASAMDMWLHRCEKQRELAEKAQRDKDELEKWTQTLTDALKPTGVRVENYNEVSVQVQLSVNIAVRMEQQFKYFAEELRQAIQNQGKELKAKSPSVVDEVSKTLDTMAKLEDKGASFVDKASDLTGKIVEVVQRAGPVAASLLPFVKPLAVLAGIPVPF